MKNTFFDLNYKTPEWLHNKLSRRQLLKSAAGTSTLAVLPFSQLSFAGKQDIDFTVNGRKITDFKFDKNGQLIQANIDLIDSKIKC